MARSVPMALRLGALLLLLLAGLPSLVGCPDPRRDDDDAADDDDAVDDDDDATASGPQVTIVLPEDGATLNDPTAVNLQGSAFDDEDGELSGDALAWSSDIDGALGVGANLVVALGVGDHVITLEATDSDDETGDASVTVTVVGENQPPQAFIDAPVDGTTVLEGEDVDLTGHATDLEDGELSGPSLFWTSSEDGSIGTGSTVTFSAPSIGLHTIVLTAVDSQGGQGLATVELTVAPVGSNLPPTVWIDSPLANETFVEGDDIDLDGGGDDPEDGALTGHSLQWSSDLDGALGSGESMTITTLAVGVHVISLVGADSEGADDIDSVTITVNPAGNDAPTATIAAPADGSTFTAGDIVSFEGAATDPEDGALSGAALAWSSSLDGALGTGSPLSTTTLSPGSHAITLVATDSGGASGTDTSALTVLAANTAPTATITGPADGSSYEAGDTIPLAGTGSDPEDGALTGSSLSWQSSLDGSLGTGASLAMASLSVGLHTITLVAVDSGGLTGNDSIAVTVDPAPVNLVPVAQLTGPASGLTGLAVTFDGSGSFDNDGVIVDYAFDFGDSSPDQAGSATSATHLFASSGTFTVTLTVTDDEGATGTDQLDIEIVDPVPVPEVVLDDEDSYGSRCDIDVDAAGLPQVIFRNDTHRQLWHASWDGLSWSYDLIDGPGFDVGGEVATQFSLVVAGDGTPHVAYRYVGTDEVRYATQSGGNWIREAANPLHPVSSSYEIEIARDPANGGRPTIAFNSDEASYPRPAVAYRVGPGNWVDETYAGTTYYYDYYAGGLAFESSGTAWMAFKPADLHVLNWSAATGFSGDVDITDSGFGDTDHVAASLDAGGDPILLHAEGVEHRVGAGWIHSDIEASDLSYFDGATNASGDFHVALRHGSDLELVHADPGLFWEYEYQGPMDATDIGVAVSPGGDVRACFFRSGNLMVFQDF
jgi:hypothetical protein